MDRRHINNHMEPLPSEFTARVARIVPPERLEEVLASFGAIKPVSFRVNTLNAAVPATCDELRGQGFHLEPVDWLAEAFTVPADQKRALTETSAWEEGRIYIQGLASMIAPMVLDPQPGETVLDLAAAPGGKTLQMAAMMQNQGMLSAVEPVRGRFFRLQANVKRCEANMVKFYQTDGRTVGRKTPERFDRILLDAPCSSEARFRQHDPTTWQYWSERKIKECSRKQQGLLRAALDAVRPGGLVLYCTCALAPEENELVIERILKKRTDVELLPIDLPLENVQPGLVEWAGKPLREELGKCVRVLANEQFDGFFLAKLGKRL